MAAIVKPLSLTLAFFGLATLFSLERDERQYVLSIIMTAMVILYVVVELGWGGGSEDRR